MLTQLGHISFTTPCILEVLGESILLLVSCPSDAAVIGPLGHRLPLFCVLLSALTSLKTCSSGV